MIDGITPHIGSKHELTIFCITDPELPDREVIKGVEYIRVPKEDYAFHVAKELYRKQADKKFYDVIHVFNRPRYLLVYKAAMPDSRFVISLHNEMFREGKISDEMGSLTIKGVDKIMTISEYIGQTVIARFPSAKRKIKTVYSGINLKSYIPVWDIRAQLVRKELREKYGVANKKVVLFVGRLSAVKGPDILIRAMQLVIQKHSDAVLVIVGSKWFHDERIDEYGSKIRQLAEELGEERVVFTGFVPPSEIPSHFLIGDIFVCSSQWQEPLARVHYEAMGAGLPVITTNRGGNAEIIKHLKNGIVIEEYTSPQAFADAILFLLSNPAEALTLAKAGRVYVESNHGFEHAAKRLINLYLRAMLRNKS